MLAYRFLLTIPEIPRLLLSAAVQGTAFVAAMPLALILFVRAETSSFAIAGAVVAAQAVSVALTAPLGGRLVDRHGPLLVFAPMSALGSAAIVGLILAGRAGAGAVALVALGALIGVGIPPLGAALRAIWPQLVEADLRTSVYALHAVVVELTYLFGPAVAGVVAATTSPAVGLALLAVLGPAGTVIFLSSPTARARRAVAGEAPQASAIRHAGIRTLLTVTILLGIAFGSLDVAAPAFSAHYGEASAAGIPLTVLAAASIVGGSIYGARRWRSSARQRYLVLLFALTLALAATGLNWSFLAFVIFLAFVGLLVSPLTVTLFDLIERVRADGVTVESGTWITTSYTVGIAAGSGVAGIAAQQGGARAALWPAVLAAAAGAWVATVRVDSLEVRTS
jgi:MFS family permease